MRSLARLALALALSGCASPGERGDHVATAPERLPESTGTCLFTRTISSWRVVDDRRIVLSARKPWIVEFYMPCHHIRFTEQLAFSAHDQRICDYRSDSVIVDGERCAIAAIRPYVEEFDEKLQEELDELEKEPQP